VNLSRRRPALVLAGVLLLAVLPETALPRERAHAPLLAGIRTEARTHSHIMETASTLCDVIGARVTGSPQYHAAAAWASQRLTEWGIPRVTTERWGPFGPVWVAGHATLTLLEPEEKSLIAYPKPWSAATPGPVVAPAVHARLVSEHDLEAHRGQLRGRIVLLDDTEPMPLETQPLAHRYSRQELAGLAGPETSSGRWDPQRELDRARFEARRRAFLLQEGAVATLESGRRDGGTVVVARWTDVMPPATVGAAVPGLVVAAEQYNRLVRLVEGGHNVSLEVNVGSHFLEKETMVENVIAEIPGSDRPGEVVILGAHLDSWHGGCGATDDAAGVAVAMEAMRILHSVARPRRTVRLGLWGGEEQGLLGSRAYVAQHLGWRDEPDDPAVRALPFFMRPFQGRLHLRPGARAVQAYFNTDYGTGRIRGVFLGHDLQAADLLKSWLSPLEDLDASTVSPRPMQGTDHQSFESIGIPAFMFIQDDLEYFSRTHHTNMDVLDRLQEQDLVQAATVLASLALQAADSDVRVPRPALPSP